VNIEILIYSIQSTPYCVLHPAKGLPYISEDHVLPDDVKEFYRLCGGADLFDGSLPHAPEILPAYMSIVPPHDVVLSNPKVLLGLTEEEMADVHDISWSWYIIGKGYDETRYISIDFSKERLGRCYDSFWEIHPYNSPIIATSFTGFLMQVLKNHSQKHYWQHEEFKPLGNAYNI
jgi:hypothetical protein